ncbi:hypothetical protein PO909_030803 [Leuciscus waleckii]
MSPTLAAAWASIATISGSGSDNIATPEGGNVAGSSSPEDDRSPSDAAIDNWSSGGALKETTGATRDGPAVSCGGSNGSNAEERGARGGLSLGGSFLTVILRPPMGLAEVAFFWSEPEEELDRGISKGTPPRSRVLSLDLSIAMVKFPQWEHDSFTNTASACARPKHER